MHLEDWWIPDDAAAGAPPDAAWLANFKVGRFRAAGGKLELRGGRLRFCPNRVDRALGSRVWAVPLDAITVVGKAPRTWNLLDGGVRVRLRVVTRDGGEHLFVVNRLRAVIAAIDGARGQPSPR
ncbi:MAG: hypothetical protein IPH80_14905 [Myxococcales bacterium]|nr:hypothetical protein [Myxococcales bacterium]MBP6843769.1 hypothetical protein [Kofleriaceae bacterium]